MQLYDRVKTTAQVGGWKNVLEYDSTLTVTSPSFSSYHHHPLWWPYPPFPHSLSLALWGMDLLGALNSALPLGLYATHTNTHYTFEPPHMFILSRSVTGVF